MPWDQSKRVFFSNIFHLNPNIGGGGGPWGNNIRSRQFFSLSTMFDLRRLNGLPARRRTSAYGLFSWIHLDCDWQTKLAVLSVQSQYNWIQLNRPKAEARRPFNLHRSNIVQCETHRRILMRHSQAVFRGHVNLLFSYLSWETGMVWWHSSD